MTNLSYGRFVDAETGETGGWDDTAVRTVEDTSLTTLLEEGADRLEYPKLAMGCKPGLIRGALVWGPPDSKDEAACGSRGPDRKKERQLKPANQLWTHSRVLVPGEFGGNLWEDDLFVRWSDGEVTVYDARRPAVPLQHHL